MSTGKHTKYIVYVYERQEGQDHSQEIKMAVNKQLTGKGHVNKVEKEEDSE